MIRSDDSDNGYFVQVDLKYPDNIKEKTKNFPFARENKVIPTDKYNDFLNKVKPKFYTKAKKLICDWSDNKKYLIRHRTLKLYVRHGMIFEKIHEIISFKRNRWLEKYINFNAEKRSEAKNELEKDFYNLLNNAFYSKTMENVGNHLILEFIEKDENGKIIKQQSKLTFNGIHKSYENCDSYKVKQNEVRIGKPNY